MQPLGQPIATRPRLYVWFWGADAEAQAEAYARLVDQGRATTAMTGVLVDPIAKRKRLAVLAHRRGG